MNRKQRRKAGIKVPAKSYNINLEQLEKIKQDATEEALKKASIIVLYNSFMVLRDNGYGKKRLERFAEDWFELFDSVQLGYLDFSDMINTIKEETGFEIKM